MISRKPKNNENFDSNAFKRRYSFVLDRINLILSKQKSIILHKEFLKFILSEIDKYSKSRAVKLDLSQRIFSESISSNFDILDSQLEVFDNFLIQVSKKDQIETILTNSYTQDIVFIEEFRKKFNYYIYELKLFTEYILPIRYIPEAEICEQVQDINTYKEIINNALQKKISKYSETSINLLKERLNEIEACDEQLRSKYVSLYKERQNYNTEIDQEEFEQEIKKVTNSIIDDDDIEDQRSIAKGAESEIRLGYQKSTQRLIAIKKILYFQYDYNSLSILKRQIKIMTELKNFAILQFIGVFLKPPCVITEYMPNGSLYNRLHSPDEENPLTPTKRTIIALGIAYGLNYMHKLNPPLLHRDLKSLNILLDSEDFPKICDFGFSRYTNEENDLKPSGVGTTNWMAPEVIKGYEYTVKSEVYSYGIILWELLTGMVPFADIGERQIKDEIAFYNRRPEIQRHDCPPEFRSLLSSCWDANPQNRISFDQIIKCFEEGTVKFIGTQSDQVKAYISLFQSFNSSNEENYEFPVITDSIINNICNELDANKEEAILKANAVLINEENHQFILKFKLIESIVKVIGKCDSSRSANLLTKTVDIIVRHKCLTERFEKEDGSSIFIKLFIKFGATSKKGIIQTLIYLVSNVTKVMMNYNAISKISPFLLFNNLSCRLNTLKLLSIICDLKCYDSENSFNVVIRNILTNIFPTAKVEIIIESLNLLLKLVKLSELNLSILATEGIIKLTSMLQHSNPEISMKSLKIIEELLKLTSPTKNVVNSILGSIPDASQSQNNDQIKEILIILAYLLKSKVTLSIIQSKSNQKAIIECFKKFLSSDDNEIVINSLKLCFSFIYYSVLQFIDLNDNYISLLNNNDKAISTLSASCLTLVYQNRPFKLTDTKNNELIENFIKRELSTNSSSSHAQVLNLCGVISTSLDGAIFFDNIDVISLILNTIKNNDPSNVQISKTATMILASLSALNPLCKHISEAFPIVFNMLKLNQNSPYPIIFIANMASTADGALECAKNISDIIQNADIDFPRTIVAIERTVTDSKAREEIFSNKSENVNYLISLLLKKWTADNVFLSIVNEIASLEAGRKAILDSGILNILQKQFSEIGLANESRPLLLRILSRIKS